MILVRSFCREGKDYWTLKLFDEGTVTSIDELNLKSWESIPFASLAGGAECAPLRTFLFSTIF
jgi:hypothetical protein